MNILDTLGQATMDRIVAERPVPRFEPGDTLRVHVKVQEGNRERIQVFEGLCIGRKNAGVNSSFTVRKISFNEGVERVTAGLEKKQRIMNEDEKLRVAYHESGHALVAYSLPNTDPVHKVSIIPRGLAALGYTMQRPEGDRFLMTQSELESRMQVLLAGTIAEEITFTDISTGASNDLERATELARLMVTKYGMSERLGLATYGERAPLFLKGSGVGGEREYSDATARTIDEEVNAILDRTQDRVRGLLTSKKAALVHAAAELKRVETLEGDHLRRLLAGEG